MAEIIEFFLDYAQQNSCAECVPCRIGTKRMQEIVRKIFNGSISEREISLLNDFAEDIGASSKCDLGKMAGKAVKFALQYCIDDINAHIKGSCGHSIPANSGWQSIMMK
ncbi:NADH-ubiquinone oxidoreductase-F iron-sulfur binding region domain-containing protein [Thermodesulfovibrio sp. TK110]